MLSINYFFSNNVSRVHLRAALTITSHCGWAENNRFVSLGGRNGPSDMDESPLSTISGTFFPENDFGPTYLPGLDF